MKQLYLLILFGMAFIGASAQCDEFILVTNNAGNTASLMNLATNTVVGTVHLDGQPWGAVVSPSGAKAYVMQSGSKIAVVDIASRTVTNTIPVGSEPNNAAMNADGSRIYISNMESGTVKVFNTVTNTIIATIPVGAMPRGISITPDGSKVYVVNTGSSTVSVINTTNNTITKTINTGGADPLDICFTPDGTKAYVTNGSSMSVSVINTVTGTRTGTIAVGNAPWGIDISPDGSTAFVANAMDHNISRINLTNNTVTATIPVGNTPVAVNFNHDGSKVYVANAFASFDPNEVDGSVSVINVANNAVTATTGVGSQPIIITNFRSGACSLPLNFLSFTTQLMHGNRAMLKWQTGNEVNTGRFVIERSYDGVHFNAIGELPAKSSPGVHDYGYTDLFSQTVISDAAVFYYRIVEVDLDGQKTISVIRFVTLSSVGKESASVYPNPARSRDMVHIRGNQLQLVEVMDNTGRICLVQQINNGNLVDINIGSLRPGLYFIRITGENNKKLVRKLIVE